MRVGSGFLFNVQGQPDEELPLADFIGSMPSDKYLFDFGESFP